jgi:hypothetical protein
VQEIEKESDEEKVEFEERQKPEANAEEHEAEATEQQSQSSELSGGEGESGVLTGSCPEPASGPGAPEKEILLLKEGGNQTSSAEVTAGEEGMEDEGKESAVEGADVRAMDEETEEWSQDEAHDAQGRDQVLSPPIVEAIVQANIFDGVETSSKDPMNIDVETTAFSSTALAGQDSPLDTCRPCCLSGLPSAALRSAGGLVSATDGSNRMLDETIAYEDQDEATEDAGDTSKQGNQGRETESGGERKVDDGNKEMELLKEDGNHEQPLLSPIRRNTTGKQNSSAELTAGEEGIEDEDKVSSVEGAGVLAMDDETSKQANQGREGVPMAVPEGERKVDAGSSDAAGDAVRRRSVSGLGSSDMETRADVQLEESENPGRDSDYSKVSTSEVLAKSGNGLGRSIEDSQVSTHS